MCRALFGWFERKVLLYCVRSALAGRLGYSELMISETLGGMNVDASSTVGVRVSAEAIAEGRCGIASGMYVGT